MFDRFPGILVQNNTLQQVVTELTKKPYFRYSPTPAHLPTLPHHPGLASPLQQMLEVAGPLHG
jgi:hypothetical protein